MSTPTATSEPALTAHPTVVDALRERAASEPDARALTFLLDGERAEAGATYGELDARARAIAAELADRVGPGERALLIFPPGLDYVAALLGALYAGVVAVPAYPPQINRPAQLGAIVADAEPAAVLSASMLVENLEHLVAAEPALEPLRWIATDAVAAAADGWSRPAIDRDTLAVLQYTSGSTRPPTGVMVTHGSLLANLEAMRARVRTTRATVAVSWLPPYHDLGLFGKIVYPIVAGFPSVLLSPLDFLARPARWLEAISRHRATVSSAPNFAYEMCVRKVSAAEREALDLSSWTLALSAGDAVDPGTLARFVEAFGPCGFRREAFFPSYGLAETCLMAAGGDPAADPVELAVDAAGLLAGEARAPEPGAPPVTLVGCGRALDGHEIVTVDPASGEALPDRRIGELWLAGPSLAAGYWRRIEETEATFGARLPGRAERWLRTADVGFLDGGEVYLTGRLPDLIEIGGAVHYPQDVERTVERSHPAVRRGCVAAFSLEDERGAARIAVVHETAADDEATLGELLAAVRAAVEERHAHVAAVVLVPRGALPKTSSGKVRRRATRAALLEGELPVLRRWDA